MTLGISANIDLGFIRPSLLLRCVKVTKMMSIVFGGLQNFRLVNKKWIGKILTRKNLNSKKF